jgi:mono/diheme cytochrome c family protein
MNDRGRAGGLSVSVSIVAVFAAAVLFGGCRKSEQYLTGEAVYTKYCITCHQQDGQGIPDAFPPLAGGEWVVGDEGRLVRLVLNGMQGPITVRGERFNNVMTPHGFLSDGQIAAVLTYVRSSFGNHAPPVDSATVAAVRAANTHEGLWISTVLETHTGVPGKGSVSGEQ